MTNYDLLNQEKCPACLGTGWVGDNGPGTKGNTEIAPCDCGLVKPMLDETTRKVSDLTVEEFKALMVECFEMLKEREMRASMEEYKRLTTKTEEVFVKGGIPVSKEY